MKKPAELAEVAEAAVRLDGVKQMVMTTGTSAAKDRGAKHLARCVRAVKAAVPDLPIQVQCEPPGDLATLTELRDAGAESIGIHVESLDDAVRAAMDAGQGHGPARRVPSGVGGGGPGVRTQSGVHLPADRARRGPGRIGRGSSRTHRHGCVSLCGAVPSAPGLACRRRRSCLCTDAGTSSRTSRDGSARNSSRPAWSGPIRRQAARPAEHAVCCRT